MNHDKCLSTLSCQWHRREGNGIASIVAEIGMFDEELLLATS